MKNLDKLTYDELNDYSKQILKEIRRRAYKKGYEQGRFDEKTHNFDEGLFRYDATALKVNKKERYDNVYNKIVERAKRDIKRLEGAAYENEYVFGGRRVRADFIVNKEKRVVVCLLKILHTNKVISRGVAKCHPNDRFNIRIGKTIALHRALKKEVPEIYLGIKE